MKVFIKLSGRIETVENVSVDDKCYPIVAGLHPYPSTAGEVSPLVSESALWFKTLAVDAVYIDCDRKWIFWVPVVSTASTPDVVLRRSTTDAPKMNDFIPVTAKPLFKDSTLYDFDASLKEMMCKCSDITRKVFKKSQTADEFHKAIAKILHVYILPSITFTEDDLFCLTRTESLIKARLVKSESEITHKANSIDLLRKCMTTLKNNLIFREDLESERYLRTCNKDFLIVFLRAIEIDVEVLNLELAAQQSKVNWAKQYPDEMVKLTELQERRDALFGEVDKYIRVREAIKNVISRRDLTKRKVKKLEVMSSCFHNVFVEIMRRLEIEERTLSNLGNDKVNICAAREAVVCTIMDIESSSNRNSDRVTKFEPEDFANYSVNESQSSQKSGLWLTFQERVSRVLENTYSLAFKLHQDGCRLLISKINLALSEFNLTKKRANQIPNHHESAWAGSRNLPVASNDVTLRESKVGAEHSTRRNAVLVDREFESRSMHDAHVSADIRNATQTIEETKADCQRSAIINLVARRALSTNDITMSFHEDHFDINNDSFGDNLNRPRLRKNPSESSVNDILAVPELSSGTDNKDDGVGVRSSEYRLRRQRHIMTQQLALGTLMSAVDALKLQVKGHFNEIIRCLEHELLSDYKDEASDLEQQELLWKSYDRFFCKEVYEQLMVLYTTALTPALRKAYTTLKETSLHEILKDDQLLDLFFGDTENGKTSFIPIPSQNQSEDKLSMARTLSDLSLDVRSCDIDALYMLANADGVDLHHRFDLDSVENEDDENMQTSSSGSVKSSDISNDEEVIELRSVSAPISTKSTVSSSSASKESFDEADKWKTVYTPEKVEEILSPVLSPFRKLIKKCIDATCFLDKVRYISKANEGLNNDISQMIGPDFQSACDDLISMLILALCNLSEDMFVGLYINLRLILDVLPEFLNGTLWDYNLVTLCVSYDYLFTRRACELVVKQYPGSFKVKR